MATRSESNPPETRTATDPAAIRPVAESLRRVRIRARLWLITSALAWLVCLLIAGVLATSFVDYLLLLPSWLRAIVLGIGAIALAGLVVRWLVPAVRFNPSLTEVALRIERTPEGQNAGLTGVLASGLELSKAESAGHPTPAARWMAGRVIEDAANRFRRFRASVVLNNVRLRESFLLVVAALIVAGVVVAAAGLSNTQIGLTRVLAPWSGVDWPRRTEVADATSFAVHPLGTALPLRAAVLRTDAAPGQTRVSARYRLYSGGEPGPLVRTELPAQDRDIRVSSPTGGEDQWGELYERLIEPAALGLVRERPDAGASVAELEYWFETSDDRTPARRIKLVYPPTVTGARAEVRPPAYAPLSDSGRTARAAYVAGTHDLGQGHDQRAIVAPVLVGSSITLEIDFSKPVIAPPPEGDARRSFLSAALPGVEFGAAAAMSFGESSWTIEWTLADSIRIPVAARDEHGLTSPDESAFSFEALLDRPPAAVVTVPDHDESVLATAVVDVTGEGRDDVWIESVALDAQIARKQAGSIGAAPEAVGEPARLGARTFGETERPTQATVTGRADLAPMALKPGDELWITAVVVDGYNLDGARHEPVRSTPRRLRVISEDELVGQIRSELGNVRQAAIRIDEEQAGLQQSAAAGELSAEERRRQAGIIQRLERQGQAVERMSERAARNSLADASLTGMLRDVGELLREAAASGEKADARIDDAARRLEEEELLRLTPEQAESVQEAQKEVREAIGQVIEMLDKGEDSWVVRRELQRLLEQQRELQDRTRAAGENTVGRSDQELTPQERAELAAIAEQQQRLSEQAQRALDAMENRAQQLREADAAQAAAMQQAAERGRKGQVPERMEQASRSAAQNQTGAAQEQQQQAMDAMEQMLDDMENAERNRDESLRRLLSSLIESLDGLILQQEVELGRITAARDDGSGFAGLDAGMIRVNQNTLGVLGEAKAAFREMAKVAELIENAAQSQSNAVTSLRADPVKDEEAEQAEQSSLRSLKLAREEARRQEEQARQRDQDRTRRELRRVYRDALEQQIALRTETAPFLGREPDRRDRMKIRAFGERQETLRQTLADLHRRTEEMSEAPIFDFAHRQLEHVLGNAAKALRAGAAAPAVGRDQDAAVRILQSLVEALADSKNQNDEFRDADSGQQGGGGDSQPQPLLPDLAQLRLLRGMQIQAAELTRALHESSDPRAKDDIRALGELQGELASQAESLLRKLESPQPGEMPAGGP